MANCALTFVVHSTLSAHNRQNCCPCDIINEHELRQSINVRLFCMHSIRNWTLSLRAHCGREDTTMECEIMNCLFTTLISQQILTKREKHKIMCMCARDAIVWCSDKLRYAINCCVVEQIKNEWILFFRFSLCILQRLWVRCTH